MIIHINWQELEVSKNDKERIIKWDKFEIKNYILIFDEDDKLLSKMKTECRNKIESEYKMHDQINIILSWTEIEKEKMKTYIEACLDEYRTKWKDANFDNINI
jgi:hypothetical protein